MVGGALTRGHDAEVVPDVGGADVVHAGVLAGIVSEVAGVGVGEELGGEQGNLTYAGDESIVAKRVVRTGLEETGSCIPESAERVLVGRGCAGGPDTVILKVLVETACRVVVLNVEGNLRNTVGGTVDRTDITPSAVKRTDIAGILSENDEVVLEG